jgi:molecular chaperone GrpE (heat shock protein)
MLKKSLILGSVFLLVGASMYWWIITGRQQERRNGVSYKLTETDDYIRQYQHWLQLPPEQRTELPLVLDKYGKDKTNDQLRQEQQARLEADMEELAKGAIAVTPFADILYGENWQNDLREYKKRNELNEYVLTGSIVCTTMGGSIYAWWILLGAARSIIMVLSRFRQIIVDRRGDPEKAKNDEPVIIGVKDLQQDKQQKKIHEKQNRLEKRLNVFVDSGRPSQVPVKSEYKASERAAQKRVFWNGTEKINSLLSDEKTAVINTTKKWGKQSSEADEHSKPLKSAINELTEQVSAIREYAASQQNRLEKLQDGYDWNIIRTFCLRVIRCIDNLENRISQLGEEEAKVIHLEEVMDELIFALESSGVEQFEPEINSRYQGQEKYAEAVKDKQQSDDPNQTGKIAQVIRPGYQYFINEGNIKVVRPAQVKLFA